MSTISIEQLKSLGNSYRFILEMKQLSHKAAEGDETALRFLEELLEECRDTVYWRKHSYWCAAVIHALVMAQTKATYLIVIKFVRELSTNMPYGAIELLASLLPAYGNMAVSDLGDLAEKGTGPGKAVAIQSLCNYFLENQLAEENVARFEGIIKAFQPDPYLTQSIVDLVDNQLSGSERFSGDEDLDEVFKDALADL